MFSYIRWFSAISFVLVVCVTVLASHYFKEIASRDLLAIVENNNTSLAQGFINTALKSPSDFTSLYQRFRASGVPAARWKNYEGYQAMVDNLSRSVFTYFEGTSIVGVSIYTADGVLLLSTDRPGLIQGAAVSDTSSATTAISNPAFAEAISKGAPTSVILLGQTIAHLGDIRASGGNAAPRNDNTMTSNGVLIKTIIPAMKDNVVPVVKECKKEGEKGNIVCKEAVSPKDADSILAVVEIRYDVTEQWKQLGLFQDIVIGGVIAIFLVVIFTLLYTSYKAETIIAKQHETNLELAAQAASAQAENRDKSQFLANVSHELRTPLNAIIGFSEFIKSERSGPIGNEKYSEYIRDIHGSGVHLLSLINDILDYSKAEADKLELEISEVDATKAVKNCMRLVSPRAETAQVQLLEEIPREHFILKTDAKKLKQVMLNLLSNAVKFTPSGGSVTVTMWNNVVNGATFIEVKDTGIGIAPKDISRAMAPFGQVDNTLSRKYEGTGLGLPLTRKFVEIMGGTFNIQSEEGKGTVITISLPREMKGKAALPETDTADTTTEAKS